ncbi:hypothetical protein EYF80_037702 [Liparis tanakae]|uniref:Uncharacterized protein n=1 Tax=Liparis tanakae TaxID=230148 RepID=A0A4Z2GH67_9TELE|nr:hypothetical protein EYF80_037702 [Liparis tanakae]
MAPAQMLGLVWVLVRISLVLVCRATPLMPADAVWRGEDLSETFLRQSNIQTSNICSYRPSPPVPTHPPAVACSLLPSADRKHVTVKRTLLRPCVTRGALHFGLAESLIALTRSDAPTTNHEQRKHFLVPSLLSPGVIVSPPPNPSVSDGRIRPGHGLSLTEQDSITYLKERDSITYLKERDSITYLKERDSITYLTHVAQVGYAGNISHRRRQGTGSLLYLAYFVLEDPDPLVGADDVVLQLLK